jgi:alpha-1,3-mannosyltransferase
LAFIEQGVNISKFHDASAREFRKSIISVGRFAQNKRLDLLVGLVQALRRHDPEWKLTIAGRPDDLLTDDVRALVEDADLAQAVDVVSSPTEQTLRRLMHESSFLASASEYEGFGITPIEGMSAGLFPLLSDIPPFQRLVARTGCGMIVDFADLDGAARRLLKSLPRISSGYATQRAASMQAANAYDWGCVCQAHAELYETITGTGERTIVPIQARMFEEAVRLVDECHATAIEPSAISGPPHTKVVLTEKRSFLGKH